MSALSGLAQGVAGGLSAGSAIKEAKERRQDRQERRDQRDGIGLDSGGTPPFVPQDGARSAPSGPVDFGAYEQRYGLPSGYLGRTAQIESSMDPSAQNPNSSASGLFQFIDSTAGQYGVNHRDGDPTDDTDGAARLGRDNMNTLRRSLGRNPTAGELYLAHQQGGGGAARLLSDPNARAADIVGSDAVRLNGGSGSMTAGDFARIWTSKFDQGGGGRSSPAPQVGITGEVGPDDWSYYRGRMT